MRQSDVSRKTTEVDIKLHVNIDGKGGLDGRTGIKFFDHLLELFFKHSRIDGKMKVEGDLTHHLIEDLALTLGEGISKALGEKMGIRRFGYAYVSMDDSLARSVIDLGGRSYSIINLGTLEAEVEGLKIEDIEHFLKSLAEGLKSNIHIEVFYGSNDHHKVEAAFKALALSLRESANIEDIEGIEIPSTKGVI